MLYIFELLGTDYIKFGYTGQWNPWMRIGNGFWTNCHPTELCNKLGPDNLNLLYLFEGDRKVEAVMQSLFPPFEYEFWKRSQLNDMLGMLRMMTEELPIPTRPQVLDVSVERLPCCDGGREHPCTVCGKVFRRDHLMIEHRNDVHMGRRWRCACGAEVTRRNLARQLKSKSPGRR